MNNRVLLNLQYLSFIISAFIFYLCVMSKTHIAFLLTGSNLGDRFGLMNKARIQIDELAGKVIAHSNFYETAAWGKEDQPNFLNQAIKLETNHTSLELLNILLEIEKSLGRTRDQKWDARTIDIDILLYENEIIENEDLQIPHKHMHERNFTLIPLMEIAGEFEHPIFKKSIETLYWESKDNLDVFLAETHYE